MDREEKEREENLRVLNSPMMMVLLITSLALFLAWWGFWLSVGGPEGCTAGCGCISGILIVISAVAYIVTAMERREVKGLARPMDPQFQVKAVVAFLIVMIVGICVLNIDFSNEILFIIDLAIVLPAMVIAIIIVIAIGVDIVRKRYVGRKKKL